MSEEPTKPKKAQKKRRPRRPRVIMAQVIACPQCKWSSAAPNREALAHRHEADTSHKVLGNLFETTPRPVK